jgi:hypothetical protein
MRRRRRQPAETGAIRPPRVRLLERARIGDDRDISTSEALEQARQQIGAGGMMLYRDREPDSQRIMPASG